MKRQKSVDLSLKGISSIHQQRPLLQLPREVNCDIFLAFSMEEGIFCATRKDGTFIRGTLSDARSMIQILPKQSDEGRFQVWLWNEDERSLLAMFLLRMALENPSEPRWIYLCCDLGFADARAYSVSELQWHRMTLADAQSQCSYNGVPTAGLSLEQLKSSLQVIVDNQRKHLLSVPRVACILSLLMSASEAISSTCTFLDGVRQLIGANSVELSLEQRSSFLRAMLQKLRECIHLDLLQGWYSPLMLSSSRVPTTDRLLALFEAGHEIRHLRENRLSNREGIVLKWIAKDRGVTHKFQVVSGLEFLDMFDAKEEPFSWILFAQDSNADLWFADQLYLSADQMCSMDSPFYDLESSIMFASVSGVFVENGSVCVNLSFRGSLKVSYERPFWTLRRRFVDYELKSILANPTLMNFLAPVSSVFCGDPIPKLRKEAAVKIFKVFKDNQVQFRIDQRKALENFLKKRFTLAWGPPGVGKSFFLALVAVFLYMLFPGIRVLVIVQHHQVDLFDNTIASICRKMRQMSPKICKLKDHSKVSESLEVVIASTKYTASIAKEVRNWAGPDLTPFYHRMY